jgi:signal transduction histidine kinase
MRLAAFILGNMETILVEWEAFAASIGDFSETMTPLSLRDHAREILRAVAKDISQSQTEAARSEKSKGQAPVALGAPETAAETHAVLRARSGFDINQLVSEYRALRASVLRLWFADCGDEVPHQDDVVRFNEAIDQAVAESVSFFWAELEQSRNLLMGMVGHDMRSPLQTIQMTAAYLGALNVGDKVSEASSRLINSGRRMQALVNDLVDYNRSRLGLGINITPGPADLSSAFALELEQLRGADPSRRLELEATGDTSGHWDAMRLRQLLGNLTLNALKYGAADSAVRIVLRGEADEVRVEVHNAGPPLDPATIEELFNPLKRGTPGEQHEEGHSLGLGLYIAREVARAHGGEIEAASLAGETTFVVVLPRKP